MFPSGIADVLDSDRIKSFFENNLFGEKCRTFDYKWLRAMHVGGFTGAHTDRYYPKVAATVVARTGWVLYLVSVHRLYLVVN